MPMNGENKRCREIDAELDLLKAKHAEIGELDRLEYEAGVDFLNRRKRGET